MIKIRSTSIQRLNPDVLRNLEGLVEIILMDARLLMGNEIYWSIDEAFCAVIKIHKRRLNKIYKSKLTKIKI